MSLCDVKLRKFAEELYKIGAIKIGDYVTKLNLPTPIYFDLRIIISYPKLIDAVSDLLVEYIHKLPKFDIICGVPYAALPLASAISVKLNMPMIMRRKEAKGYGMKKMIEGVYKEGDRCLIIEDVVTSGSSILETVKDLNDVGITCTDTIILMNREQGGSTNLKRHGISMHSLLNISQLLKYLNETNYVDDNIVEKVTTYLQDTQVDLLTVTNHCLNRLKLPYSERAVYCKNKAAEKLFKLMSEKQTNLCVAADVTKSADLINLAEQVGPHICLFKTHIDILDDFNFDVICKLKHIAKQHNFILFEDRKFADIGKTVQLQYTKGNFQISSWAELVTAHSLAGRGLFDAIKASGDGTNGVFLLAEISSAGSIIDKNYTEKTLKLAAEYSDLVTGIVCQNPLFIHKPEFIQLTPGVQLDATGDNFGQQYNSPEVVMLKKGADVAVVGRGITHCPEASVAAEKYKRLLWDAYLRRIE